MDDGLLALLRVAHGLTAAIWLGISIVGVLSPAALAAARASGGLSLRALAQTSLWVLVVTGAILMLDRLADPSVSTLYVALLGLKLALVAGMGLLALVAPVAAGASGVPSWRRWLTATGRERALLAFGLGAYVLGSLLTSAYEAVLRSP